MMRRGPQIQMVYPRMLFGGAEESIVHLLRSFPNTHMIVTHAEGLRAEDARAAAGRYTLLGEPRLLQLIQVLQQGDVAHLHTINEDPRPQLAALLAGVEVIVQTLHNDTVPDTCQLVDHNIVLNEKMLDVIDTPGRASVVPCAIDCGELTEFSPWFERVRPLTIVECRRPDKKVSFSLVDVVRAGALDGLDYRLIQVGFEEATDDPRVMSVGPQKDPRPWIAAADFLFCGHDNDTFGRSPMEALALGTLPFVTPLPVFEDQVACCSAVTVFSCSLVEVAAREIRERIAELTGGSLYDEQRRDGFEFVRQRFPMKAMADATWSVYEQCLSRSDRSMRCFGPGDVCESQLPVFCELVEAICEHGSAVHISGWERMDAGLQGVLCWVKGHYGSETPHERLQWFERSAECLGTRALVENEIGYAASTLGRFEYAAERFERSLALDNGVCTSHFGYIDALLQLGDGAAALAAAEQFVRALPDSTVARPILERVADATRGVQSAG